MIPSVNLLPQVRQDTPKPNVSQRYVMLSTADVIDQASQLGLELVSQSSARARPENKPYARHLLRFRDPDLSFNTDVIPEIVFLNAHNGHVAPKVLLGAFRLACANGMIIGDVFFSVTLRHSSVSLVSQVQMALAEAKEAMAQMGSVVNLWKSIMLTREEQTMLASVAAHECFPEEASRPNYRDLLSVRREADQGIDLWTTFNIIQEAVIRGGQQLPETKRKRRGITSVARNVTVNQKLWSLADRLAEFKMGLW